LSIGSTFDLAKPYGCANHSGESGCPQQPTGKTTAFLQ